jgi:hypothetical protein
VGVGVRPPRGVASRSGVPVHDVPGGFRGGGFGLTAFDETEAAFRFICFLVNLVALFKRDVTENEPPRLVTWPTRVHFFLGGDPGYPEPPADPAPWAKPADPGRLHGATGAGGPARQATWGTVGTLD